MRRSRAAFPTTISPDGLMETTLGTSLSPSAPGIILGPVRSRKAARLLVVPRSIPMTFSVVPKSMSMGGGWLLVIGGQLFVDFVQQVLNVLAAVQSAPDFS